MTARAEGKLRDHRAARSGPLALSGIAVLAALLWPRPATDRGLPKGWRELEGLKCE